MKNWYKENKYEMARYFKQVWNCAGVWILGLFMALFIIILVLGLILGIIMNETPTTQICSFFAGFLTCAIGFIFKD